MISRSKGRIEPYKRYTVRETTAPKTLRQGFFYWKISTDTTLTHTKCKRGHAVAYIAAICDVIYDRFEIKIIDNMILGAKVFVTAAHSMAGDQNMKKNTWRHLWTIPYAHKRRCRSWDWDGGESVTVLLQPFVNNVTLFLFPDVATCFRAHADQEKDGGDK